MLIRYIHYQSCDPQYYHSRPDGLDEYVLILAHSPAYFHTDDTRYLLKESQLFLYDKGKFQLMYGSDGPFIHDWFHFDMTHEEREEFERLGIPFGKPISVGAPAVLSEYIRMLAVEFNAGGKQSPKVIEMLLKAFFFKLSDQIGQMVESDRESLSYYQEFNNLRSNIKSFPYQEWSLERAAQFVSMSKTWFQHKYKELFGVSFCTDVINFRIDYAKRVLLRNDYPVGYVAQLCGYNSDIYFMRQFKEKTGFTPSEYRTQCRQNHHWQKDCPYPDTQGAP